MAVNVVTNGVTVTHDAGLGLVVNNSNGHMYVTDGPHRDADTIAVYAAGHWSSAVIVPSAG